MSYKGQIIRIPLDQGGFSYSKDTEQATSVALVEPTRNINFHEKGLSNRGGTAWNLGSRITGTPAIRGLFDYRLQNGNRFVLFTDSIGKLYHTNASNVLKAGLSTNNYTSFANFDNKCFLTDGASVPQYWDGSAGFSSGVTEPTDWATEKPFQFIPHAKGASARLAAVTTQGVWLSQDADGADFSDANSEFIPVYSNGGLVGGFDFGGTLFVWDRTKGYIIDDSNIDPQYWGYQEVQWEGGLAHWRLIVKAANDLYLMTEDGLIYSISATQRTGDYEANQLTRPAYIDRWIREKVSLSNIEKFHAIYDRKLRAIKWFVQVSGSNTNTALVYFIDRPPEIAWTIHNNTSAESGYDASVSAEVQVGDGDFEVWTGDFAGMVWKTEQSTKDDENAAYKWVIKIKRLNFNEPKQWKHFSFTRLRGSSDTGSDLSIRTWIDDRIVQSETISFSATGARYGEAIYGTSVYASGAISNVDSEIKTYGYDIQTELSNEAAGDDFFLTEIAYSVKGLGTRP